MSDDPHPLKVPGPGERIRRAHTARGWERGRAPRPGDPATFRGVEVIEVIEDPAGFVTGYQVRDSAGRTRLLWRERGDFIGPPFEPRKRVKRRRAG